jgi:hypothetical protein
MKAGELADIREEGRKSTGITFECLTRVQARIRKDGHFPNYGNDWA